MKTTIRLTMAQALVRYLAALRTEDGDGTLLPLFGGAFAIFGHIFGKAFGLNQLLDGLVGIATNVTKGNTGIFALITHLLNQLLTTIFGKCRN